MNLALARLEKLKPAACGLAHEDIAPNQSRRGGKEESLGVIVLPQCPADKRKYVLGCAHNNVKAVLIEAAIELYEIFKGLGIVEFLATRKNIEALYVELDKLDRRKYDEAITGNPDAAIMLALANTHKALVLELDEIRKMLLDRYRSILASDRQK